jgi:hypothetical protein
MEVGKPAERAPSRICSRIWSNNQCEVAGVNCLAGARRYHHIDIE